MSNITIYPSTPPTIATHSGTFQTDEALAVYLVKQLPQYQHSQLIRTRDPNIYDKATLTLDVGGVYNHNLLKYDHHQRDFNEYFQDKNVTKLSTSGLIYRHYGKIIILQKYPPLNNNELNYVYFQMYDQFMECIDAVDNGVEISNSLKYHDHTGLSSRIKRLNPRWNESRNDSDERFELASTICGKEFMDMLNNIVINYLPARDIVSKSMKNRFEIDSSGEIACFNDGGLPWIQHLYYIERELNINNCDKNIKFLLYPDNNNLWRCQAVTIEGKQFSNRVNLPYSWRGLRGEELKKVSGINGVEFCHGSGFIGGARNYGGVLEMAKRALSEKSGSPRANL